MRLFLRTLVACLLLSLVTIAVGHAAEQKGLDLPTSEWQADGVERRKLRESLATLQRNLHRANASLARAIELAESTTMNLARSGLPEKLAQLESAEKERARWLHEQAARDRERQQKEREAAQRERGVR